MINKFILFEIFSIFFIITSLIVPLISLTLDNPYPSNNLYDFSEEYQLNKCMQPITTIKDNKTYTLSFTKEYCELSNLKIKEEAQRIAKETYENLPLTTKYKLGFGDSLIVYKWLWIFPSFFLLLAIIFLSIS
ncbi:MAG TPA: hypothetical protein VJH65_00275 [Candidatus Nanoarchaeia archaeon]|nr:hypothetical protein [Candidatus Nanoarchaeia archaeon]